MCCCVESLQASSLFVAQGRSLSVARDGSVTGVLAEPRRAPSGREFDGSNGLAAGRSAAARFAKQPAGTLRAPRLRRSVMDPSPLVPGTLVGLELFIYWEKRPLCRSKQSLVSRSHSVYGPAAERTITGDSFLRCRPLTSRRLRQPLRGHGIPIPRTWECPA